MPRLKRIVSRTGGWKTALNATKGQTRSPSLITVPPVNTAPEIAAIFELRSPLKSLWSLYEHYLQKAPIRTQSLALTVIWGSGDLVAQKIEGKAGFDIRRSALTALYGGAFLGPAGHVWYRALDNLIGTRWKPSTLSFIVAKVAADNLCFTPIHVVLFFGWLNFAVEGDSLSELRLKLQKDYWPTVIAELLVWPGWQILTFRVVPLQHQLMTSNLLTLGEAVALPLAKAHDDWFDWLKQLPKQDALVAAD